jgi:hypothetical protein
VMIAARHLPLALSALLVLAALGGCGAPPRSARPAAAAQPSPEAKSLASFEKLLAGGRNAEVIDGVEARLPATRDPVQRAQLEALRARALLADGRARSALLSYQRAERELTRPDTAVKLQILQGQGDAEMALSHWRLAIRQYAAALKLDGLATRQRDDLAYSAYIAAKRSGDTTASAWRGRVRSFSAERVAALEKQLVRLPVELPPPPAVAVATPALSRGQIPDDPQLLLKEIHRRGEWGARPIRGAYDPMKPVTRITVHHSAELTAAGSNAGVGGDLRDMQASHQAKWADLGYHFVVDPNGGIWEGRALKWQGAHEGAGLNQGAIGICLMGNFETQPLPSAQVAGLSRLLDALCRHFGVDAAHIKTHREVRPDPTDCPGAPLQHWMDDYRRSHSTAALARK